MSLARPSGAVPSAVALAIVASLGGAPQLLQPDHDHAPHRCSCPAGPHVCTCARCLAAAREGHGAGPRAHGSTGEARAHGPTREARACCRRATSSTDWSASDHRRPPAGVQAVSASCGDLPVAVTLAAGADPFVAPRHLFSPPAVRAQGIPPAAIRSGADRAAPEPPPPRA